MNQQAYHLFLSYGRTDTEIVQQLASELSDVGIHVWFDQWELIPGQDCKNLVEEAMRQSRVIGICVGQKRSRKLDAEISSILSLRQLNLSCTVVPILLPKAHPNNIPATLAEEKFIDFREGIDNPDDIKKLINIIFLKEENFTQSPTKVADRRKDNSDPQASLDDYERTLTIALEQSGPTHLVVASLHSHLGSTLQELGELKRARQEYEQALAVDTAIYGMAHPSVTRDLKNLGSVLVHLGEWESAHTCYKRALAIRETKYGKTHPKSTDYL